MSNKYQLLDPLSTMCKLISLVFCELNTKIAIHNHVLVIQNPNNYQSIVRTINGDTKEDISQLYHVIIRLIKWYLLHDTNKEDISNENWLTINQSEEIIKLMKYLCIALKKLQLTYEYGNVIFSIQFYINIIEDTLNGNFDNLKLPNCISGKESECDTLLDYSKLKNFWDLEKLKRISDSYTNCFKIMGDTNISDPDKKLLIDGYLSSINASLQIMDTEFQKLILNSNRG
jgi:hypothetical protein